MIERHKAKLNYNYYVFFIQYLSNDLGLMGKFKISIKYLVKNKKKRNEL